MKLRLKWGLFALVGLWALHGVLEEPRARTVLLIVAMGVALWTAFSLNIPPKRKPEEEFQQEESGETRDEKEDENSESSAPDPNDAEAGEPKRPPS